MDYLSVEVLPLTNSVRDVEELEDVLAKSFGSDDLAKFTSKDSEDARKAKDESIAKHMKNLSDPRLDYRKAVSASDPNGRILGVALWFWVDDPHTAVSNIAWGAPPTGEDTEVFRATIGALRQWRLEYFSERNQPFLYLMILAVAPDMRRRGVGGALLEAGVKEADRRRRPAIVSSSADGLQLYKKFGWEEKVEVKVNLADYGGEDVEWSSVALVRPPKMN